MRQDKQRALKLRRTGKSYSEIKKILGVPKGTLSSWFSKIILSDKARERLAMKTKAGALRGLLKKNQIQTHRALQRMHVTRLKSKNEIRNLSSRDLRLFGIALYWAEGYKRAIERNGTKRTYHPVAFSNADPIMAKIFIRFLEKICRVPRHAIRIELRIFKHMNPESVISFWIKTLQLSRDNVKHIYYGISTSSMGKRPFHRLPHGTIQIRVNDTTLFHQIMGWIDGVKEYAQH